MPLSEQVIEPGWDEIADVVVAGGGGAGLRAAMVAAEAGARVTLIEKNAELGGKTSLSIGIMTASGTSVQRAAGITDSHGRHLADIEGMAKADGVEIDVSRTKFLIGECNREIRNLIRLGIEFTGPFPEGPHGTPRLHVVQPDCRRLIGVLAESCAERGVTVRTACPASELVIDHRGRVAGLVVGPAERPVRIRAGAVVLAAGDYSANAAFLDAVAPDAERAEPFRDYATGDGHQMAMRIGAGTQNMDRVNMPHMRFLTQPVVEPSPGLFAAGARLVTAAGEAVRTVGGQSAQLADFKDRAEDLYVVIDGATAQRLATASDDKGPARDGWMLTGKPFIGTAPGVCYAYLEDCRAWAWYHEAQGVAEAARHIGCDGDVLSAALGDVAPGPLHVLGPARLCLSNTGGGLTANKRMNVLATDGKPIAGLYAAGVNARLITFMGGHGYSLAWAFASGRLAGKWAAAHAAKRRVG